MKLWSVQDKNGAVSKLMCNADIAILNKCVRPRKYSDGNVRCRVLATGESRTLSMSHALY